MIQNKGVRILLTVFYYICFLALGYLLIRYVFFLILPFLLAFALARISEPFARLLTGALRLPRKAASAVSLLLTLFLLGCFIFLISRSVVIQFKDFFAALPETILQVEDSLASLVLRIETFLGSYFDSLPMDFNRFLSSALQNLKNGSFSLPSGAYGGLLGGIASAASSLPSMFIAVLATVISAYFISTDYAALSEFFKTHLPESAVTALLRIKQHLFTSLGRWLKAQGLLILVTFCELTVGFIILKEDYAGVLALLIACIDALPILGVGTVLIPWGIFSLLMGNWTKGVTLLIFYIVIAIVRNSLEPKIVGQQLGLHPLATLLCLYLGYQLFGFAGMFLLPILVITAVQLVKWGYLPLSPFSLPPEPKNKNT